MKRVMLLVILIMVSLLSSAASLAACNAAIEITKPDSLYIDHGDGTVTDRQTGLMWQTCSLELSGRACDTGTAVVLTWQAALAAANDNTDYNYSDWRLPNISELASLLEDACFVPAINASVFPNVAAASYWSSSPYAGNNNNAWNADFIYGYVTDVNKDNARYVRLVRGSQ